jgi:hypothetical protein
MATVYDFDYSIGNYQGNTTSDGQHSHSLSINASGGTEARPKNAAIVYIIKY